MQNYKLEKEVKNSSVHWEGKGSDGTVAPSKKIIYIEWIYIYF